MKQINLQKIVITDCIGDRAVVSMYTKNKRTFKNYPVDDEIIGWIDSGDEELLEIFNNNQEVDGVTCISSLKKLKIV